jgi:hypothetical protein
MKASAAGLEEAQYDELLNFESSDRYDDRQKAALAYAQATRHPTELHQVR